MKTLANISTFESLMNSQEVQVNNLFGWFGSKKPKWDFSNQEMWDAYDKERQRREFEAELKGLEASTNRLLSGARTLQQMVYGAINRTGDYQFSDMSKFQSAFSLEWKSFYKNMCDTYKVARSTFKIPAPKQAKQEAPQAAGNSPQGAGNGNGPQFNNNTNFSFTQPAAGTTQGGSFTADGGYQAPPPPPQPVAPRDTGPSFTSAAGDPYSGKGDFAPGQADPGYFSFGGKSDTGDIGVADQKGADYNTSIKQPPQPQYTVV